MLLKNKLISFAGIVVILFSLTSCCTIENCNYSHFVNFIEMERFAKKADVAYKEDEEEIRNEFGANVSIGVGKKHELKWFVQHEDFPSNKTWIVIRGTANIKNVSSDIQYVKTLDSISEVRFHRGFEAATREIYDAIKANLDKKREIYLSGHSLGGAAVVITMIWLKEEGYNIQAAYTFGQPKVTNAAGAKKYSTLKLIRVINDEDMVPYAPPTTLLSLWHGRYTHFGDAVILLKGKQYQYLEQNEASKICHDSYWLNIYDLDLKDHYMEHYLKNIKSKLKEINEVSCKQS